MKKLLGRQMFRVAFGAILALGSSTATYAGSCAANASCDILLNNSNTAGLDLSVKVTIDNTGATTILKVEFQSVSGITNSFLGIDNFNFNYSLTTYPNVNLTSTTKDDKAPAIQVTGTTGGFADSSKWNSHPDNADGFGSFEIGNQDPSGSGCDLLSPCTFTLQRLNTDGTFSNTKITDFAENANSAEFAVHVRFSGNDGSCSGWVSDGNKTPPLSTLPTGCEPNSPLNPTPEPGTLLLVGSLLSGLGVFGRKRFLKIVKE